jgi:hypothetical protein
MVAKYSSETLLLTRATRCNIQQTALFKVREGEEGRSWEIKDIERWRRTGMTNDKGQTEKRKARH